MVCRYPPKRCSIAMEMGRDLQEIRDYRRVIRRRTAKITSLTMVLHFHLDNGFERLRYRCDNIKKLLTCLMR